MGWTYQAAKFYDNKGRIDRKAECDAILTYENDNTKLEVLKSAMKGTTYYAAVRNTDKVNGTSYVFAAIFLTATDMRQWHNFGYKDMDETVHPYCHDCPKSILEMLTEPYNDYAKEWREACWQRINARKSKKTLSSVKIGEVIEFEMGGRIYRAQKMAPAYQFSTPWYKSVDSHNYIRKTNISKCDWRVIETV